ncbi:hypothetical protein BRC21_00825 [Candidatus Saccharibacteria bacterium SW_7_54_9]|nr:MAG: hypothetical protein BRC21_00825 [Candidatus Saccharibacteria bacterium SW_7_54_9]
MHVVVNTLSVTPSRGGVKTCLLNLLDGLLAREEEKQLTLLCSEENKHLFARHDRKWACVEREVLPLRGDQPALRIFFDQVVVPLYCRQYPDAVLLSQASASSLAASLPEVVIVQVPLSVRSIRNAVPSEADNTSWPQRLYYDAMLPLTLCRADQVVAVSDYLRQEIADLYPQFAHKVRMVHEGVNLDSFKTHGQAESRNKPEVPYLLFVSTLFPYKRADQAVRAFARVINREGRKDLRLKLAGKDPGEESQRLKQIAHDHGVYDRVDVLGVVSHDEMPKLYRGAEAFLFPSTVETFGLPVLEAMACGTPVIASDRMSVPEIVGDAGLLVDPDDTSALTDAVCRLLENESLRKELREAGKERAQHFTWERTARGAWKALEDAKESATT